MMNAQRDLFSLDTGACYLNNAYFAPSLIRSQEAGKRAIDRIGNPFQIVKDDFFQPIQRLSSSFSKLIDNDDPERIALLPSASYGLSNAAAQVCLRSSDQVVVAEGQFPSNMYPWMRITEKYGAKLVRVPAPEGVQKGREWNARILDAINEDTAAVAMAPIMWSDGTLFDLQAIRNKTREHDALLIIDGSQWIGAQPFSIAELQPDVLVTAAYKWLLGPYGMGLAYYGEHFDQGRPIEDSWITRENSEDFRNLTEYTDRFRPKALRYSVGEHAGLIRVPMLQESLDQLLDWGVDEIADYSAALSQKAVDLLGEFGEWEEPEYRATHLFGLSLPDRLDPDELKRKLDEDQVYISMRGRSLRISLNVFNSEEDLLRLREALKKAW